MCLRELLWRLLLERDDETDDSKAQVGIRRRS